MYVMYKGFVWWTIFEKSNKIQCEVYEKYQAVLTWHRPKLNLPDNF